MKIVSAVNKVFIMLSIIGVKFCPWKSKAWMSLVLFRPDISFYNVLFARVDNSFSLCFVRAQLSEAL